MSTTDKTIKIKRFGYIISAVLLIVSNISLVKNWPVTPIIFLVTMYFLTGSLWIPVLVKPFYVFFDKLIFSRMKSKPGIDKDIFSKN